MNYKPVYEHNIIYIYTFYIIMQHCLARADPMPNIQIKFKIIYLL